MLACRTALYAYKKCIKVLGNQVKFCRTLCKARKAKKDVKSIWHIKMESMIFHNVRERPLMLMETIFDTPCTFNIFFMPCKVSDGNLKELYWLPIIYTFL